MKNPIEEQEVFDRIIVAVETLDQFRGEDNSLTVKSNLHKVFDKYIEDETIFDVIIQGKMIHDKCVYYCNTQSRGIYSACLAIALEAWVQVQRELFNK